MYQRSAMLVPVIRGVCGSHCRPVAVHTRNLWDLVRGEPRIIRDFNRDMERMERVFRMLPFQMGLPRMVQIAEDAEAKKPFHINVDVEGFRPEDIKISMKNNVMRIEAKTNREDENGCELHKSFVQEFSIPSNVDQSSLKSFLHNNGVLRIEADVMKEAEPKHIPIQLENETTSKTNS